MLNSDRWIQSTEQPEMTVSYWILTANPIHWVTGNDSKFAHSKPLETRTDNIMLNIDRWIQSTG